jgi:WD40 repeat protein
MTDGVSSEESLPLSAELRIDSVCGRFEAAWQAVRGAGAWPVIEAYLGNAPEPERAALLRELLALELDYRKRRGERPTPEEYRLRFREHGDLIDTLFVERRHAAGHPAAEASDPEVQAGPFGADTGADSGGTPLPGPVHEQGQTGTAPALAADWPAVPGYEILGELGRGAMGVVYRARHQRLKRVVALKMVLGGPHAGPAYLARFRTEAEAAARLHHPNIVQIYENGEHGGLPFLALELVDGGTLHARLGGTPQDPREAAGLVEALARAMHTAHRADVVHRDLKPANVLLAPGDSLHGVPLGGSAGAVYYQPKVSDFGLAKQLDDPSGQTGTDAILGTPGYMAPEQAAGNAEAVGPAADTYALGAILYECLTGRPPFKGATVLDTLEQVRTQEPVPPRALQPKVPRDLETICLNCLRKEPHQRYARAEDLAADLRCFHEGKPIRARPVGSLERAAKWARRRPAAAALLLVGGLALLALGGGGAAAYYSTWLRDTNARLNETNTSLQAALDEAGRQRKQAVQAKGDAEDARREKEGLLYLMSIERAHAAWRENEVRRADDILTGCSPELCGNWEWRYVHWLCHSDLRTLKGHAGLVQGVAWSPDGSRLASASFDRTVKVWDAQTGQESLTLRGQTRPVYDVAWSPDGSRLASAAEDNTVRVWDARTGQEILVFRGHKELVDGVAWSPDGSRLASAAGDRTVKVWDAKTGQEGLTLTGHTAGVFVVAFSPDGSRLASASFDQTVKIWDASTGQGTLTLRGHTSLVHGVAWSPDGSRLASASSDQTVKIWDTGTGQEVRTLTGHTDQAYGVAFSPDGSRLASTSHDNSVRVWDVRSGQEILTLKGHTSSVLGVAWSPDGSRLASASEDKTVKIWDPRTRQEMLSLREHNGAVDGVTFSPDGSRLASASQDKTVKIWDTQTGQEGLTLRGHTSEVWGVAWSPDGSRLASASLDHAVKIWDARTGREALTLGGHKSPVYRVAFSRDGSRLASASADQTVKVWDTGTGQEALTLTGHTAHVNGVAWSPDGTRLASASDDQTVRVWDAGTGQEIRALKGHNGLVCGVAWSPDGSRLASAGDDGMVRIWDPTTGQETLTLRGHTAIVRDVAFSPDGSRLASASADQTVKVWDVKSGQEALTLRGRTHVVSCVAWSPDGSRLAGAWGDATVMLWPGMPLPPARQDRETTRTAQP